MPPVFRCPSLKRLSLHRCPTRLQGRCPSCRKSQRMEHRLSRRGFPPNRRCRTRHCRSRRSSRRSSSWFLTRRFPRFRIPRCPQTPRCFRKQPTRAHLEGRAKWRDGPSFFLLSRAAYHCDHGFEGGIGAAKSIFPFFMTAGRNATPRAGRRRCLPDIVVMGSRGLTDQTFCRVPTP